MTYKTTLTSKNAPASAMLALGGLLLAGTPGQAAGLPDGVTVDTSLTMNWSHTLTTVYKNGRRKVDRSNASTNRKYRIFRKGNYVLIFVPPAQPGTVFGSDGEIRNVGYKAGINRTECVTVNYEAAGDGTSCARYSENGNGFRIDFTGGDDSEFQSKGYIQVDMLNNDCRTSQASDYSKSFTDEYGVLMPDPDAASMTEEHQYRLARSSCRLLKGQKTF